METSECFIFGKICACLDVIGNIVKYNSPYIVDLIICPLGHFSLIIFAVGRTLFRWAYTAMDLPCILNHLPKKFPILFLF